MRLIILMDEGTYNIDIVGFHGTSLESAQKIITEQNFTSGDIRNDHWLGQGAYFFREDPEQAKIWAKNKIKGSETAVIKTIVSLDNNSFLNLDTRSGLNYFNRYIKTEVKRKILEEKAEIELTTDDHSKIKHIYRCFFCNELPTNIKAIQRTFFVQSTLNEDETFKKMDVFVQGVQVCIRDLSVIDFTKTGINNVINMHTFRRRKKTKQKRKL